MDVMTINLRFRNSNDVGNLWDNRRHIITDIVNQHLPTVIGTQEGYKDQLDDLARLAPGYAYIDAQRLVSVQRQCPTIFYRRDLLTPVQAGNFWLSEKPWFSDSKSWDTAFPRMVTYALFKIRETEQTFYFFNTHFDHVSAWARKESALLLIRKIREINPEGLPVLLVGDFNMGPHTPEHQMMTGRVSLDGVKGNFHNVWEKCGNSWDGAETFHGFTGQPKHEPMDWILATSHFRFFSIQRNEEHDKGRYPSDHFPVLARLALPFIAIKKRPERK